MSEEKKMEFKESSYGCFPEMVDVVENWFGRNKENIRMIRGVHGVEQKRVDGKLENHHTITLMYEQLESKPVVVVPPSPKECEHLDLETFRDEPTCLVDGLERKVCKSCFKTVERTVLPKLPHDLTYHRNNDETCVTNGTESATCTICHQTFTRIVAGSATGHPHRHHRITAPKCLIPGLDEEICDTCGVVTNATPIPPTNHPHTHHDIIDPICITEGADRVVCDDCGVILSSTPIPTIDHNYVYTFNNDATCLEDGTETGVCSMCGDSVTRTKMGSALGHSYPATWITSVEPTYETTGEEYHDCIRCGHRETRVVPALNFTMNITTNIIDGAVNGTAFTKQLTADQSDVTWGLSAGSLPPGLSLNTAGKISGTPSSGGVYTFTVFCKKYNKSVTKQFTMNVANRLVTVTFNANGGSTTQTSKKVAQYSTIGTLPTASKSGQNFGGWFTATTGGLKVDANYTVTDNITLYARWGATSDIEFGDVTTQFNIQVNGDRTNYNNNPYTLYSRQSNGAASNLAIQTGISSADKSSNMSASNKVVRLYMKITNNGAAGTFDVGFDCDSYASGDDKIKLTRIAKGIQVSNLYTVTVNVPHVVWLGLYSERTNNRFKDVSVGTAAGTGSSNVVDSGYAFTLKDIFINNGSYAIVEVTFTKL